MRLTKYIEGLLLLIKCLFVIIAVGNLFFIKVVLVAFNGRLRLLELVLESNINVERI